MRGRISKTDLLKECNRLIRFIPTEDDKLVIMNEQKTILGNFEGEMNKKRD